MKGISSWSAQNGEGMNTERRRKGPCLGVVVNKGGEYKMCAYREIYDWISRVYNAKVLYFPGEAGISIKNKKDAVLSIRHPSVFMEFFVI